MSRCVAVYAAAALLIAGLSACSKSTPTSPTVPPTPTVHPSVSVTSMSVAGEGRSTGYGYRVVMHLRESAGTPASITSVDLTFMAGTTTIVTSHHEQPISHGSNVCPASGAVDTRELLTTDADTSHAYATSIQAKLTYSDGVAFAATASASADVPPPATPPPAPQPKYTLTGVITDASTHAGIGGALLEVLAGQNAGKTATADGSGAYVISDLVADSFRLRASATDYLWGEQGVTVPANPRADFELRHTLPPANAVTVYTYVGNQFNDIASAGKQCPAAGRITGSFSVDGALPPNRALAAITATSFSFTSGALTITNQSPGLNLEPLFTELLIATGPSGEIANWTIHLYVGNYLTTDEFTLETVNVPTSTGDWCFVSPTAGGSTKREGAGLANSAGLWSSRAR